MLSRRKQHHPLSCLQGQVLDMESIADQDAASTFCVQMQQFCSLAAGEGAKQKKKRGVGGAVKHTACA